MLSKEGADQKRNHLSTLPKTIGEYLNWYILILYTHLQTKRVKLATLSFIIIITTITTITPVYINAQSNDTIPLKNALAVITAQNDNKVLQSTLTVGGLPSNIKNNLELAKEILHTHALYTPTDENGQFELDAPLNVYNVTVFAPGFVMSSNARIIAKGNDTDNTTIYMQPSAIISGQITDIQGKPISGIVVAVDNAHSTNYDITTDDGIFVLDSGIKTGLHKIYAFKPSINISNLQTILNNNTELNVLLKSELPPFLKSNDEGYISYSSTVEVEQGKITNLNIELQNSQTISGKITDENGNSIPNVAVFAFDKNGTMINDIAISDSDGRYTLRNDLSAGKYTLIIPALFSKGYAPVSTIANIPTTTDINMILHNSSIISGKVIDANGHGLTNVKVFAISENINQSNNVTTHDLAEFAIGSTAATTTNQQGMFTINKGISKGVYNVTASLGNVPVSKSIEVLSVSSDPINITLNISKIITISGKITDSSGMPIENAAIVPAFASAIPGVELFAAKTDHNGIFRLTLPLQNNDSQSLFKEISAFGDGYRATTIDARNGTAIRLEKMPIAKIRGIILTQKSLPPPIETILERKWTIIFDHNGTKYSMGLNTNLHVSDSSFYPQNKSITVDIDGVQNSVSTSEFTIPKGLLGGPFIITSDETITQTDKGINISENQTYSTIKVQYDHTPEKITIQGTTAAPEFPIPNMTLSAQIICLIALLAYRRLKH